MRMVWHQKCVYHHPNSNLAMESYNMLKNAIKMIPVQLHWILNRFLTLILHKLHEKPSECRQSIQTVFVRCDIQDGLFLKSLVTFPFVMEEIYSVQASL